ncbi:MAG: extracellular solute-binding protein, partial [Oscillospiraceae bacterium]|nr:extracellular solute-binding protein [Oscillospiraceae bacterium]
MYPVRKRFAAAAALMMLSAVSCADGDKPADETAPTGTAPVTSAESTASQTEQQSETSETVTEHIVKPIDNSVPVTFTFYSCAWDEDSAYDEAVTEKITELTGVTLEMIYPSSDDLFSDLMAMKASGDLPDLIYAGEYTEKLVSQKIFSPLDTLIDDYGGNFKAMYGG